MDRFIALWVGAVVFFFVSIFFIPVAYNMTDSRIENALVVKSERVCDREGDCKYLVFTDKGVFENTDSLFQFKFNSSDVYADIVAGKKYDFDVVGWRVRWMSMYQNIVNHSEVK